MLSSRIQKWAVIVSIGLVFCSSLASAGKNSVKEISKKFAKATPDVSFSQFEKAANWNCEYYDIVLSRNLEKRIYNFRSDQKQDGTPVIVAANTASNSMGIPWYFIWEGSTWVSQLAGGLKGHLRQLGPNQIIEEISGDPDTLAGAYIQVSCKKESDCFLANSIINPELWVTGYSICRK